MSLISACRDLNKKLSGNDALMINTCWYQPGDFNVSALRYLSRDAFRSALAQAGAEGLAGIEPDATINIPAAKKMTVRQWFRALGEALANSLHLTR